MKTDVGDNLDRIEDIIRETCRQGGRKREEIELVAVSKFHPVAAMIKALECGQYAFGENYVQEWQKKSSELASSPVSSRIKWHFTGHLQSRKARFVAGRFSLIHSLDSWKLAQSLQHVLEAEHAKQDVLIEVNIGSEKQKTGLDVNELKKFSAFLYETSPNIILKGLMCLPPAAESGQGSRVYFDKLRCLRDDLELFLGIKLPVLSMGMSGDFQEAILAGATIIRVGTAIFGPRPITKHD